MILLWLSKYSFKIYSSHLSPITPPSFTLPTISLLSLIINGDDMPNYVPDLETLRLRQLKLILGNDPCAVFAILYIY